MSNIARQPSLLLYAGHLGAAVAARVGEQLGSSPGSAQRGSPADAFACLGPEDPPESLRERLDHLLGLPQLLASRSTVPRLLAFAVADVNESRAAEQLRAAVDRLVALVRQRYAALFADYRDAAQRGFLCNPILVLPAPGEAWPPEARALLSHLEALQRDPKAPPAVSNIFVLGESSGRYLLPRAELAQMVAGFLELALSSDLAGDPALSRLLARTGDPFGTFVCATAELDAAAARRYCATATVVEVMDWLRRASEQRANVADRAPELAELFDIRRYRALIPLEKGARTLDEAIDSECPGFDDLFRDVLFFEDAEEILAHYGATWQDDCRQRLEAAHRELGLFRVDEVIEEVEINGAAQLAEERQRVDRFIDEKLGDPSEGSVADAALALSHLRKRLDAERDSLRDAATAPLGASPELSRFDRAYEECTAAIAEKPRRRRLLLWGLVAWAVATVTTALLLRKLALLLGAAPGSALHQALHPPWAWLTAAATTGVLIGAPLLARVFTVTSTIRRFVGHRKRRGLLRELLDEISRGPAGSLRAYYGSRFRRACDIWIYRTLLAALKHVDDRLRRLEQMQLLLEAQAQRARRQLQAFSAPPSGSAPPPAPAAAAGAAPPRGRQGLFGDSILYRSLIASDELPRLASARREPREIADLVADYCRTHRPFARWEETLPFSDLDEAITAAEPYHAPLFETSVLLQPDLEAAAIARLERFFGDFGQRLDFPLDFSGRLFRDDDDVERSLASAVVAGAPAADVVAHALRAAGISGWQLHTVDEPGHRVRLLKLVTGIAREAIRWHDAAPEPRKPSGGGAPPSAGGAP